MHPTNQVIWFACAQQRAAVALADRINRIILLTPCPPPSPSIFDLTIEQRAVAKAVYQNQAGVAQSAVPACAFVTTANKPSVSLYLA